jgi:Tfp pilus assembly protein PilE
MPRYPGKPGRGSIFVNCLVLLGALGAMAAGLTYSMPAYRQYAIRMTRADAQQELLELSQRLQRCFRHTSNYGVLDKVPNQCVTLPQATPQGTYVITGDIKRSTFLLVATPQMQQAEDIECGAFTVNQTGQPGITGTGKREECWSGRN